MACTLVCTLISNWKAQSGLSFLRQWSRFLSPGSSNVVVGRLKKSDAGLARGKRSCITTVRNCEMWIMTSFVWARTILSTGLSLGLYFPQCSSGWRSQLVLDDFKKQEQSWVQLIFRQKVNVWSFNCHSFPSLDRFQSLACDEHFPKKLGPYHLTLRSKSATQPLETAKRHMQYRRCSLLKHWHWYWAFNGMNQNQTHKLLADRKKPTTLYFFGCGCAREKNGHRTLPRNILGHRHRNSTPWTYTHTGTSRTSQESSPNQQTHSLQYRIRLQNILCSIRSDNSTKISAWWQSSVLGLNTQPIYSRTTFTFRAQTYQQWRSTTKFDVQPLPCSTRHCRGFLEADSRFPSEASLTFDCLQ